MKSELGGSLEGFMEETRKRILVVDDDASIRMFIRRVLEHQGYEVLEAPDGEKGIQMYRKPVRIWFCSTCTCRKKTVWRRSGTCGGRRRTCGS
jgi:hypothetical protein